MGGQPENPHCLQPLTFNLKPMYSLQAKQNLTEDKTWPKAMTLQPLDLRKEFLIEKSSEPGLGKELMAKLPL